MDTDWIESYILENYIENPDLEEKAIKYLEYKSQFMTKPLYKFYSFDCDGYNINNFKKNIFYMQNPMLFNDPLDCNIGFGYSNIKQQVISSLLRDLRLPSVSSVKTIQTAFNKKYNSNCNLEEEVEQVNDSLSTKLKEFVCNYVGVSCLSENRDSLLMWSHYADKHEGFCVEYDFSADSIDVDNYMDIISRINIYPVIYSIDRPNMAYITNFDIYKRIKENVINAELRANIEYNLLFKSNEWSYEKEWRIIGNIAKSRICASPLPKAVYIGVNAEEKNKQKIIEIAKEKEIPVYQMKLSDSKYAFDEPELIV